MTAGMEQRLVLVVIQWWLKANFEPDNNALSANRFTAFSTKRQKINFLKFDFELQKSIKSLILTTQTPHITIYNHQIATNNAPHLHHVPSRRESGTYVARDTHCSGGNGLGCETSWW